MKHYLLFYEVVEDYAARRAPHREEHLKRAWAASDRGELLSAGALANPVDGAVLLFRGESPEVAERFARADPYVAAGLVERWRVREWTTVVGESAAAPMRPSAAARAESERSFDHGSSRAKLERPHASEYAAYAKAYVDLVAGSDVIEALARQQEDFGASLESIDDARAAEFTYAPGKWTVKQVVNHVIDTERVFAYRALSIARNDLRPLAGFEQEDYAQNGPSAALPLASLLDEFRAVRAATIWLFRNLPEQAWLRRGTANQYEVTVRGLAFHIAGHERHHAKILRERYLV